MRQASLDRRAHDRAEADANVYWRPRHFTARHQQGLKGGGSRCRYDSFAPLGGAGAENFSSGRAFAPLKAFAADKENQEFIHPKVGVLYVPSECSKSSGGKVLGLRREAQYGHGSAMKRTMRRAVALCALLSVACGGPTHQSHLTAPPPAAIGSSDVAPRSAASASQCPTDETTEYVNTGLAADVHPSGTRRKSCTMPCCRRFLGTWRVKLADAIRC